jgi:hypothetical protein
LLQLGNKINYVKKKMATTQEHKYQREDKDGVVWEHNDQHKKEEGYSLRTRRLMQRGRV